MTDVRKCDGQDCDQFARLDIEDISFTELTARSFITVERRAEPDLHFHDKYCLAKWAQETTRVKI